MQTGSCAFFGGLHAAQGHQGTGPPWRMSPDFGLDHTGMQAERKQALIGMTSRQLTGKQDVGQFGDGIFLNAPTALRALFHGVEVQTLQGGMVGTAGHGHDQALPSFQQAR